MKHTACLAYSSLLAGESFNKWYIDRRVLATSHAPAPSFKPVLKAPCTICNVHDPVWNKCICIMHLRQKFSHFHIETKLFCFDQNLYSSIPIFGKNWPQGANKIVFSDFFVSFLDLHIDTKLFFLLKFHIYNGSEISWEDKRKRYINDNDDNELSGRS